MWFPRFFTFMDLPRVALSTYLVSTDLYPLGPDFVLFFSKLKINRTAWGSVEKKLRGLLQNK